jgi:hypothetical protein
VNLELLFDREYFSLYINGLWPNGVAIEIPTWLLIGSIAFIYSIHLIRKDKEEA